MQMVLGMKDDEQTESGTVGKGAPGKGKGAPGKGAPEEKKEVDKEELKRRIVDETTEAEMKMAWMSVGGWFG